MKQKPNMDSDPMEVLAFGTEGQEKLGQNKLVHSDVLPQDMRGQRAAFEGLGFVFGADVDDLFIEATLPEGWRKERTDHNMWSNILDDKNRIRARIFYKAAFYDRSAHMGLSQAVRFGVEPLHGYGSDNDDNEPYIGRVTVDGVVVYETEELPQPDGEKPRDWYLMKSGMEEAVRAWVNANYPDWQNPLAYWG